MPRHRQPSQARPKVGDKVERYRTSFDDWEQGTVVDISNRVMDSEFQSGNRITVLTATGRIPANAKVRMKVSTIEGHVNIGDTLEALIDEKVQYTGVITQIGPGYVIGDFATGKIKILLTRKGGIDLRIKIGLLSFRKRVQS